ncbi:MAG: hypothetical protein U0N63_01100 [Senegalimassilia anaerobia]
MKKIYAVATESDVVLAFESRSDADEYAGEHGGAAGAVRGGLRVPQREVGHRLGPNRRRSAEGRRAGMRLYMCACERCGKEVPATLAGYAKMVLRNSARIDGKARALCPECAESLRAWFLAGAVKPEGRE